MARKRRRVKITRLLIVLIIVLLLILIALLGLLKLRSAFVVEEEFNWDNDKFVYENGLLVYDDSNYESITGIDVCSFNKDIDWQKVKADGIDFAILRCGFRDAIGGELYLDPKYDEYMQGALDAGIDVGIYFYSSALTIDEVYEEIEYVQSLVEPYDITYPIAYDMEPYENGRLNDISVEDATTFATTFCDAFNEMGYQTMIYGNKAWLTQNLDFEQIKDKYDIWYAAYISLPELEYPFTMWQYTSSGIVDGIEGNVDIDLYIKEKEVEDD